MPFTNEKISQLADAGSLTGAELIPLVRFGAPNLNLSTTVQTLREGATGGPTRASKTSNYTVLPSDSGTIFDTLGATGEVDFTLPVAPMGNQVNSFVVAVAQPLRIIAPPGVVISVGPSVTVSGGNAVSNVSGSLLSLYALSGVKWISLSLSGTWTLN